MLQTDVARTTLPAGRDGPAIEARGLVMRYGDQEVLHGIDLVVQQGMVLGFLGPNGAGKTTTIEILEGYRRRAAGYARVLGMDPATGGRELRERIGIVLQETAHNPDFTVRETVRRFAGYYRRPRPLDEVIGLVELQEAADRRVRGLSGGQRRRLDVALALVGDPELVFLDEPTTGFDPAARRQAWRMIGGLRDLGKTILLTTHYMDEAQELADRVAIIQAGRIVAEGTRPTWPPPSASPRSASPCPPTPSLATCRGSPARSSAGAGRSRSPPRTRPGTCSRSRAGRPAAASAWTA